MTVPLTARLASWLLILVPVVRCAYEKRATSLVPPSFLETAVTATASQSAEMDSDILFYISDEDRDNRVAVNFQDAVNYAISSLDLPCEDEDEFIVAKTNEFMTGDLYDNDLTDVSKLKVKVATGSFEYRTEDSDELEEEEEDQDEAPNLVVLAKRRDTQPLRWDRPRKDKLDLDDWETSEVDTSVSTEKDHQLPIPAQKVPSREIVYDLDEEAVFVAGERKVIEDLDDVPMFYSADSRSGMVGDMFDNKRTDQILLKVLQRSPEEPVQTTEEETKEVQVDVFEVSSVDIVVEERKDVDDLDEVDVVFEPKDIEVIPEHHGGDLPLITAYDRSPYMVGDLFDNERTDAAKLTIEVLTPTTTRLTWFETAEPEEQEKPVFEDPTDVDDLENIYVQPATVDFDEGETLITKVPVVFEQTTLSKLLHQSPSDIITGDLYNNQRTDSSRLNINEIQGRAVTWDQMRDVDDMKTVYDLQTTPDLECDSDDVDEIDLAPGVSTVIDQINSSSENQAALLRSRRISGDRFEFYDLDDVPAFFSFDSEDYVAGDMFDNGRSDSFKLTIEEVTEGRGASWGSKDYDDSKNPGFLQ